MPLEILMPALSPTMEEGHLSKWHVKEGDIVRSGDILAEIETDKATMEIEAVEEGKIVKILVPDGTESVKVNTPIAILLEDDEDESVLENMSTSAPQVSAPRVQTGKPVSPTTAPKPDPSPASARAASPAPSDGGRVKASPLAKRIAKAAGLDIASISGSGPNGRIIKADVEAVNASPQQGRKVAFTPSPLAPAGATTTEVGPVRGGSADYLAKLGIEPGSYDLVPLDGMRRTIATRLTESFRDVPHFPLNIDCEIDALLAMRKQLNEQVPEGVRISVNDILIRASAIALKQVPAANASFTPDGIAHHHHADVAVAVAIDGGLITPIVREAENKGLSTISSEMKDLAARARTRKLKPQEYQGGTFSISNLGMMGIKSFGSIINQPQGMILSVGAGTLRPIVKDGEIGIATVMSLTLSCDHRAVDGAIGAQWLGAFKSLIEKPVTMML